ncbi:DNA translocase FtsK [bacterium]|jgi:DNA segregation ATPase FtsK/SpoIIIE, S-DNA-T family|nr:DNA translocase FtsK [bacterium]MBT4649185.1 DNA translocase FtsK [bacterium]
MARRKKYKKRGRPQTRRYEEEDYQSGWSLDSETKKAIIIVIIFLAAFLGLLSMFDAAGAFGGFLSSVMSYVFGWGDWLFILLLLFLGYILLNSEKYLVRITNYIGLVLIILAYSGLFDLFIGNINYQQVVDTGKGGGALGYGISGLLENFLGFWGALLILIAALLVGLLLGFNTSFRAMVDRAKTLGILKEKLLPEDNEEGEYENDDIEDENAFVEEDDTEEGGDYEEETTQDDGDEEEEDIEEEEKLIATTTTAKKVRKIIMPMELLTHAHSKPSSGDINANMSKIKGTLENFGIEVTMGEVNVGPTVTQYTLRPAEGVKLSQILTLQNDLALSLAAHPLRIEAPIPGKSLVGVEVPNQTVSLVKIREILESEAYSKRKNNLHISLGRDVAGTPLMANLAKMPHLLIAGATGSGKSVCINNVITSLIYQNSPDELKFIMVDPKRVELAAYNDIPHLLTPVVHETDKTINALRWAVKEMDDRYKLLQAAGKKNIESYNKSVIVNKIPYIVIIIDELADLMQTAAKEVEAAIIRLAQMARAIGIHLVLATQRPSTNVITGLIKANITSRIAFSVASNIDSRTIIDSAGAEKLLGNGDMLFVTAESSHPKRIQGAFISEEEINSVTDYVKSQAEPEYKDAVVEKSSGSFTGLSSNGGDYNDELTLDAKEIVIKAGKASATLLQRRLRVGYARAARLLDILEEMGVVSPADGSKPREVFISQEELEENFSSDLDEEALRQAQDDEGGQTELEDFEEEEDSEGEHEDEEEDR